jgi:hypothetical protein
MDELADKLSNETSELLEEGLRGRTDREVEATAKTIQISAAHQKTYNFLTKIPRSRRPARKNRIAANF